MLENLTLESFEGHEGETFRIQSEEGTELETTLAEVERLAAAQEAGEEAREPFSVILHGPPEPVLPQRIYRVEHEQLGELDIFLVPIGPAEGGEAMRYQAVFS